VPDTILSEETINASIVEETISITLNTDKIYYGTGSGDMQSSIYDKNNNGIVDGSEAVVIDTIEAKEDFLAGDLISINGYHPDSNDITFRNRIAGIVLEDIQTGHTAKIATSGLVENINWSFTPNSILFLNVKSISQTAPTVGFIQEIGRAITNTKILIDIKQAIML